MTLRIYQTWRSAAAAAGLCAMAACAQAIADAPEPSRIVIKSFMFSPASLSVAVGATVTWANMDDEPHTVVSESGLFRSGAIDTRESFSFKFDKPGTYHFACSLHPQMIGTVVVQ